MKQIDQDFNFTVVGGGTAGWLTALYIKGWWPDSNVTVVASSDIGILGAGEGSTPHLMVFLKELNIPVSYLIKHAKATIKSGIRFSNWAGDDSHYFQTFTQLPEVEYFQNTDIWSGFPLLALERMANGGDINDLALSNILGETGRVPFRKAEKLGWHGNKPDNDFGFDAAGSVSLHFDANQLAMALQNISISRGIKLIDDKVLGFQSDEQGNIKTINLETHADVNTDFVFDCTGFKRLIIGKHYGSKWNSYNKSLPVDTAIPFFIPNENGPINPWTQAIAMKNGWQWQIPVQDRYGCGYVFDSDLITPEQAKQELDEFMGYEVESPRVLTFDPGSYEKTWIKNCCAIGLSTGFIEPLEATSIWTTIMNLHSFSQYIRGLTESDITSIDNFNRVVKGINDDTLEFIHFHYLTKRNDTEFWKTFRERNVTPPQVQRLVDELKTTIPDRDFFEESNNFPAPMWWFVFIGAKMYDPDIARRQYESFMKGHRKNVLEMEKTKHFKKVANLQQGCFEHRHFLSLLKNDS